MRKQHILPIAILVLVAGLVPPSVAFATPQEPAEQGPESAADQSGESQTPAPQAEGRIVGAIIDEYNGMTLPTAPVEVVGSTIVAYADLDGNYELELDAGVYSIRVTFPSYATRTMQGVVVTPGKATRLDIVMLLESASVQETITVVAEAEPDLQTEVAQLVERKNAGTITDNISAERMKKSNDGDAAAAVRRVTGVSVVDNQYVFVRGLGERYSNTTLNGAVLPTTEPDKRVVPLDLFPTGLIDRIKIIKSYQPDKPAEFSGGLIEINSLSSPSVQSASFGLSQGYDEQSSFETGLGYAGGGRDRLGIDDGTRALPSIIPDVKVVRGGRYTTAGFSPAELEQFGESFSNIWSPEGQDYRQNQGYNLFYGNSIGNLGLALSATYGIKNNYQEEIRNFYKAGTDEDGNQILALDKDYDFRISTQKVKLGLVGNLSFKVSPNHRLSFQNMFTRNSKDEARTFEGYNADARTDLRNQRLFWVQEEIFTSKFGGEHFFPSLLNSRVDWRVNHSTASRDEPDLREVMYEFSPGIDKFVLADESQSGLRMFNELDDKVIEGGFDWNLHFEQWAGFPALFKFGPSVTRRERDFQSRRFRFTPRNVRGLDLSLPAEQLFTAENIGTHFELKEETRPTDTYNATHDIDAFYGMLDLPLARKLRVVGGLRVEKSLQEVVTFDLFNPEGAEITATLENTDVLPGINLLYQLTDEMNLRTSFSNTLNRPEFRELSPFEFTDVVGGRAVVGNPELRRAKIANFDLRWEWFPSPSEVIAASFFHKDFTDPIERVVQPTAQLRTSYENATGATNKGFEIEARKRFADNFFVALNYTFVESQIELEEAAGQVQTSLDRPLAGQSGNVFNATFEAQIPSWDLTAAALVNYFDRRISDVGASGLPDIYEEGRANLDVVFMKRLGKLNAKLAFGNLLDADYEFTQGGEVQRLFSLGRTVSLSLSYAVF